MLLLLACVSPVEQGAHTENYDANDDEDDDDGFTVPKDTYGYADTTCPPVGAVFFDLGETLVTETESGLFANIPEAVALLDALATIAMPMGVITNTTDGWTRDDLAALLEDPWLLERFDVLLLSSEAESRPKPAPDIYIEAVAMLPAKTPIETTVFVTEEIGDIANAEPPTRGARAAGMIGVLVSDTRDSLADHTIAPAALAELASAEWLDCIE